MALFSGIGNALNFEARITSPESPSSAPGGYFGSLLRRAIAGVPVNSESALTYGAYFACVRNISELIAMMPQRVYITDGDKRHTDSSNPVDRLLYRQANDETNAYDFKQAMFASALSQGNGLAEIERNRLGQAVSAWQVDWDRVNVTRDSSGRLVYEISNGTSRNSVLMPKDVLHLKGFSINGVTGLSVVSFAKQGISLGLATEQFGAAFFGNGAMPGGVIEWADGAVTPQDWSLEAAKNLKKSWNKNHQGSGRHSGVEVLEPGQRFKAITIPPEDAQFLESRKANAVDVARWFGVPPHKIGILDRATNANLEAQNIEYVSECLGRWAARWEMEINAKLLTGNSYTKINFNSLLRGDIKTRTEHYQMMLDRGAYSINEVRALEDKNPIEHGDIRLVQMNMATLEQAAKLGNTAQQKVNNND